MREGVAQLIARSFSRDRRGSETMLDSHPVVEMARLELSGRTYESDPDVPDYYDKIPAPQLRRVARRLDALGAMMTFLVDELLVELNEFEDERAALRDERDALRGDASRLNSTVDRLDRESRELREGAARYSHEVADLKSSKAKLREALRRAREDAGTAGKGRR